MARYAERSSEWMVQVTINGDARKDTLTFTCVPRGTNPLTNFFDVIRVTNNIPLLLQLGTFGAQTNIVLNTKGTYVGKGPWF